MTEFIVYTDGACHGNPGVGSWAFIVYDDMLNRIGSKSGFKLETTNNEMELTAIIELMKWAIKKDNRPVAIFTDSAYCKNGMESWVFSWQKKGWKKADGTPPLNLELWKEAFSLLQKYKNLHGSIPNFTKVKGHSGDTRNDEVDSLCAVIIAEQELAKI